MMWTGFCTSKGELVRSILFPKEVMFKFYEDAVKFIGVLACLATMGMIYSATALIMKHVRLLHTSLFSCPSVSDTIGTVGLELTGQIPCCSTDAATIGKSFTHTCLCFPGTSDNGGNARKLGR